MPDKPQSESIQKVEWTSAQVQETLWEWGHSADGERLMGAVGAAMIAEEDQAVFIADLDRRLGGATPAAEQWWGRIRAELASDPHLHMAFGQALVETGATLDELYAALPRLYTSDALVVALQRLLLPPQAEIESHISDTRGWTPREIEERLEFVRDKLDWENTTGSAMRWWEAFERENAYRPALVLRLAEELLVLQATITEFFLAYVYSNTDNILANVHYLRFTRLKKNENARKRLLALSEPPEDVPLAGEDGWAVGEAPLPTGITDTRGWTDARIREILRESLSRLRWEESTPHAHQMWEMLEARTSDRPALLLRLVEELAKRKVNLDGFRVALTWSNCDDLSANLHYIDYARFRCEEAEKYLPEHERRYLALFQEPGPSAVVGIAATDTQEAHLISAHEDGTIRIFESDSRLRATTRTGCPIRAFLPEAAGGFLTGHEDGRILQWKSDGQYQAMQATGSAVTALFRLSENRLVSGNANGALHFRTEDLTPLRVSESGSQVMDMDRISLPRIAGGGEDSQSEPEPHLVSGHADGRICFWTENGAPGRIFDSGVRVLSVLACKDEGGNAAGVISSHEDNILRWWSRTGEVLRTLELPDRSHCLLRAHGEKDSFLIGLANGSVLILDNQGLLMGKVGWEPLRGDPVLCMRIDASDDQIISGHASGRLARWNGESGRIITYVGAEEARRRLEEYAGEARFSPSDPSAKMPWEDDFSPRVEEEDAAELETIFVRCDACRSLTTRQSERCRMCGIELGALRSEESDTETVPDAGEYGEYREAADEELAADQPAETPGGRAVEESPPEEETEAETSGILGRFHRIIRRLGRR